MRCPTCGYENEKGANFCEQCGGPLGVKKKGKKGGGGAGIWIVVSLAVLLAAAGVTVAVMLFLGIGPFKLNSSGTDQGDDPQPQTWQTETQLQPDTGESETQTVSGLVMIDIDGVTNQQCTVEGTIGAESGGNYPLQLQPLKTVYAYDEGGAKETLTNVASLYVVPGQAVASDKLSLCAGIEVQVTGSLQIRGDRVYLIPSSIVRSDGQPIEPAPPVEEQIHRYELVVSDCTWEEAFSRAAAAGGYLVRINTQEEYETILSQIQAENRTEIQFFIGGRRAPASSDPYGYYWAEASGQLQGERLNNPDSWCAGLWMRGEPSYMDGNSQECYMNLYFFKDENRWVWNDVPNDTIAVVPSYSGKVGYIVEYE